MKIFPTHLFNQLRLFPTHFFSKSFFLLRIFAKSLFFLTLIFPIKFFQRIIYDFLSCHFFVQVTFFQSLFSDPKEKKSFFCVFQNTTPVTKSPCSLSITVKYKWCDRHRPAAEYRKNIQTEQTSWERWKRRPCGYIPMYQYGLDNHWLCGSTAIFVGYIHLSRLNFMFRFCTVKIFTARF